MTGLQAFWLLKDLTQPELAALAADSGRRTVPHGTVLFRQGDPTPGLHLVEAGAIKIYRVTADGQERIIDLVGPGQCCGEMGVVDGAPSAAWGQALGETRLWVVPPAAFERLLLTNPRLGLRICRVLVAKLRQAGSQLEETFYLGARERVLAHLARLAERHGQQAEGGVELAVRLTHQEIARLAGTSRETVTRVLNELQDRQLLTFIGRRMRFASLPALRELTVAEGGDRHDSLRDPV